VLSALTPGPSPKKRGESFAGDSALQQVNISLGTATQIDHGKTALLKRLTVLSLDSHPHASVEHGTQTFSTCC
jgi:hypothetical protein